MVKPYLVCWRAGSSKSTRTVLAPPAPRQPRDVVVYFDNDVKVRAPVDAIALADRLSVGPPPAPEPQLRVRRR